MSAEDWSLNGKITRKGHMNQKQPRAMKQVDQKFVAIKREIVELMSFSGYLSREKVVYDDGIPSEKYVQLDESRKARSSMVLSNARLYRTST